MTTLYYVSAVAIHIEKSQGLWHTQSWVTQVADYLLHIIPSNVSDRQYGIFDLIVVYGTRKKS